MAIAVASDGTELHWEASGDGPAVLLVPYWSYHPSVWNALRGELGESHRLIAYDDRGTGRSERVGPYDVETAAGDMEAVLEAAQAGPAVAVCLVDGSNRATRVAARRPDLISHVVSVGGAPFSRSALAGSDSMISSDVVVGAFQQQMDADYRGAIRSIIEAANMQMSDDEIRVRVQTQVEHVPQEVAAARVRSWSEDEGGLEPAREIGGRLLVLVSENMAGGWFPSVARIKAAVGEHFPEARVIDVDDGVVSRPDQTAAAVRKAVAESLASDAGSRA